MTDTMDSLVADVRALLKKAAPLIGDFSGVMVSGEDVEEALMFLSDANESVLDEARERQTEIDALWRRL
jgi:hypothetical protein